MECFWVKTNQLHLLWRAPQALQIGKNEWEYGAIGGQQPANKN
jgi:hypothetical protein